MGIGSASLFARTGDDLDATALAARVRAHEASPVAAVESALERIDAQDGALNAHTVVLAGAAREQAQAIEATLSRGEPVGPLAGVPFSVKDVTWVRGAPATNGSAALRDFAAPADAVVVERMRAAGAILVGKTNNPELCLRGITDNQVYGVTRNPWSAGHSPGGSSGGAGAAVAAGMTPLALGSDGGGSIRIPASFCGVAGIKPSYGRVPDGPGFDGWLTLTVNGALARSVRDLRLCLDVLAGPDPRDPSCVAAAPARERTAPLRIAFSVDLGFAPVAPDVRAAFARAVDALRDAGLHLVGAAPPTADANDLWTRIAVCEGYASHRTLLEAHRDELTADTVEILEAGAGISAAGYLDAMRERARYTAVWSAFFERYDALLTPSMQITALPLGVTSPAEIDGQPVDPFFDDWCAFCLPANLTGQPAVSVPCGRDRGGLPIGLQVMARRFDEHLALDVAAAWERIAPSLSMPSPTKESH